MRILFVDDEQNVLQGLRRSLRSMRKQWKMEFVDTGQKALATLKGANPPYQIIVSDMRMPGMDGSQVLHYVKEKYPGMLRFALSGGTDENVTYKITNVAHQFLSKPCDTEMLKSVLEGGSAIIRLLKDERLRSLLTGLSTVPSIPDILIELNSELRKEDPSMKRVGKIIASDIGMTAKTLQLVNSAFFGVPHSVTSPEQAATMLGLETIKALVMTVGVFNTFDADLFPELDIESVWRHGRMTGLAAKKLCEQQGLKESEAETALLAGSIHDAGKIVLASHAPVHYLEVLQKAAEGTALLEAERDILNADHAEAGAYVLGTWGLPAPAVMAVALHHQPRQVEGVNPVITAAVHFANAAYHGIHPGGGVNMDKYDASFIDPLLDASTIKEWEQICHSIMTREKKKHG